MGRSIRHQVKEATSLFVRLCGMTGRIRVISEKTPDVVGQADVVTSPESRVKRLTRWLKNDEIKEEIYFLPYAEMLLQCLALETVVLVMDGSGLGRGCSALMIHVVYQGRALHLA